MRAGIPTPVVSFRDQGGKALLDESLPTHKLRARCSPEPLPEHRVEDSLVEQQADLVRIGPIDLRREHEDQPERLQVPDHSICRPRGNAFRTQLVCDLCLASYPV